MKSHKINRRIQSQAAAFTLIELLVLTVMVALLGVTLMTALIDFPASWHNGGGSFSFADGRAEMHKWVGRTIKPPTLYLGTVPLNFSAGDSYVDVKWLAANTTVRR